MEVLGVIEGEVSMVEHHSEKIIQGNGIEICTDAFGDTTDPVILLIMGAGCSMIHWDENWCQRLADAGRFVIRYDNRDTGRTSLPPGECSYSFADMAADAVAVLDHYGADKSHILGQSMGGIIAQLVVLNYPERVLTLMPIMTTANPPGLFAAVDATQDANDGVLQPQQGSEPAVPDLETVLASVPAMLESAVGSAHPPEIERMCDVISRDFDRSISYASSANHGLVFAKSQSLQERLGSINVPTLVIHGTEDPIVPFAHGEEIAANIPGAQLLTMKGVGHFLPRPEYDRLVSAILEHTS
jgi:pimeloyl-ACP methyl ester carboxylesterase